MRKGDRRMKIGKTALAILLVALLTAACGQEAARPYTTADAQALLDAGAFNGEMQRVEGAFVTLVYGLDGSSLTDYVSYQAMDTAVSADEVTVLILADEDAASAAEAACRKRVESQIENCRSYAPGALPDLEAAVIDRVGNTVLLAVGDPERLPKAIEGLK